MENSKKNVWKPIAIISLCLLIIVSTCYGLGIGYKQTDAEKTYENTETQEINFAEALSLWNDDAAAKKELTEYLNEERLENHLRR